MLRLKDTSHANTAEFLSSAIRVAEHYGFTPFDETARTPRVSEFRRRLPKQRDSDIVFARREERPLLASARRIAARWSNTAEGVSVWRTNANVSRERSGMTALGFELHIVGNASAIAEALLIVVADAIAKEAGVAQRIISINNIGSTESSNRYVRDVSSYLRKHIESISPTLRPRAAIDPLGTLVALIERGHPAVPRAPQAMEYLTEEERRRFWELLEYLEMFGLSYELSPQILGSRDCWAHTLFEISTVDAETGARIPVAFGGRYDPLASRFARSSLPSTMISVTCEMRGRAHAKRESSKAPAIYFAHLGPEARRRALQVLEHLRLARIPVYQGLLFERIGEQMAKAKQCAAPYVLIMGHKEAVEGTILVREVVTNSQEAVPIPDLVNYLKRRRMDVWKEERV